MTYRDKIVQAMDWLGEQPDTCVVGYNVSPPGGSGGGTFNGFPLERRHEMPLAEALMAGVATGMSLDGHVPILWIERSDFLLHAADQIVNHLDKLRRLSRGSHKPAVIIRVAVGNKINPLFTGPCHTQNFAAAFRSMVSFTVHELVSKDTIVPAYKDAYVRAKHGISSMVFEFKDKYSE